MIDHKLADHLSAIEWSAFYFGKLYFFERNPLTDGEKWEIINY